MPPRKRATITPIKQITDEELDARLLESVPETANAGYEGHKLRVAGWPWQEIAERIGSPSAATAQRTVSAYLREAAKNQSESMMQEALQTQIDRYEAIVRHWWVAATSGGDEGPDEKAASVVLRALERLDRVLRLTEGDVTVTKETLVVSADPEEYIKQLKEVVESRTSKRS